MDEILFAVLHALDLAQIVRRVLVDVVVQPVLVQQVSMGAPAEQRRLLRVIDAFSCIAQLARNDKKNVIIY